MGIEGKRLQSRGDISNGNESAENEEPSVGKQFRAYDYERALTKSGQSGQLGSGRGCTSVERDGEDEQCSTDFRCVWANDIDKYACQIYRKNFGGGELVEADIRSVDPSTIPDFDLLTAGFPCQSFSVAGKRLGFEDTRGTLFYEIIRVLKAKRPPMFLLENVRGLLSHESGKTFHTILRLLSEAGYTVEWMVLNSKDFGVPQNRERVFIVGHLGAFSGREVFPVEDAHEVAGEEPAEPEEQSEVSTAVDHNYWKGADKHGQRQLVQVDNLSKSKHNPQAGRIYDPSGLTPDTSNALDHTGYLYDDHHFDYQTMSGRAIRRLTPVECERLQGFPDDWTKNGMDSENKEVIISDPQRYKTLGNAITTNFVTFIGKRILECASEE